MEVTLTEAGLHAEPGLGLATVAMLFQYLHMLEAAGPQEWVWRESKLISDCKFRCATGRPWHREPRPRSALSSRSPPAHARGGILHGCSCCAVLLHQVHVAMSAWVASGLRCSLLPASGRHILSRPLGLRPGSGLLGRQHQVPPSSRLPLSLGFWCLSRDALPVLNCKPWPVCAASSRTTMRWTR